MSVRKGRFGPYVQHGKTVANLPRGAAMEDITLDDAVALLAEKGKPLKVKGAGKRKAASGAPKASAPKPTPAAKPAPKREPVKKPAKKAAGKKQAKKVQAKRRVAAE